MYIHSKFYTNHKHNNYTYHTKTISVDYANGMYVKRNYPVGACIVLDW